MRYGAVSLGSAAGRSGLRWTEATGTTTGGATADRGEEIARYLPKEARERLSPVEREETDRRRRAASRVERQLAPNTPEAAESRRETTDHAPPFPNYDALPVRDIAARLGELSPEEL